MNNIILLQLQNKSKHSAYSESLQQLNKYNLSGNPQSTFLNPEYLQLYFYCCHHSPIFADCTSSKYQIFPFLLPLQAFTKLSWKKTQEVQIADIYSKLLDVTEV